MPMDGREFFHQTTICICEGLEIDKALMRCFKYLKDFFPLDEMRLNRFNHDFGSLRAMASADASGGTKLDAIIPLPQVIRDEMDQQGLQAEVRIINRPEDDPVTFKLSWFPGQKDSSIMILPLILDEVWIGALGIRAAGRDRYTNFHARLLSMLHDPFAIALSNSLKYEGLRKKKDILSDDNRHLKRELKQLVGEEIVGAEFGLKQVMDTVRQVAPLDNPVLLLGERGVGKKVIANAIHDSSNRKERPFIKVNCGAIPEKMTDSELFGLEKGIVGAVDCEKGYFEQADGGTILLDGIGNIPYQTQTRLLRMIRRRQIKRVGGSEMIPVDVRIIAATHRKLEEMIDSGRFQEDLWFKLNVSPIIIPPLRQRKSDIPALAEHFLKRKSTELNYQEIPPITPDGIGRLMDCHWKGNVLELKNVVERALIQHDEGGLDFDPFICPQPHAISVSSGKNKRTLTLDEVDTRHIESVLQSTRGKINGPGGAAERLCIHPSTLRHKMDRLGIRYGLKRRKTGT